jgi:hypothetical protein
MIKYFEYRSYEKVRIKELFTTLLFGYSFLALSCGYYFAVSALPVTTDNFWGNKSIQDGYFIIMAIILTIGYRIAKWDVKREIPSR